MLDVLGGSVCVADDAREAISEEFCAQTATAHSVSDSHARTFAETGAKHLRNHLPAAVLERFFEWRGDPSPWLTVSNLPQPRHWIPTPVDGFCDERDLTVPNLVQFGMLHLLGLLPVAYRWENDGRLMRNVAPRPGSGGTLTSWGYSAPLDWHTDDSVLDHEEKAESSIAIPHYLSFYGMRNDEGVPTELLTVDTVTTALPQWVLDDLRLPEFLITAPESYAAGSGAGPLTREGVPVMWTLPSGRDAVRYGPGRISGLTLRANRALNRFERRLGELDGTSVLIGAGDFHVFDNRRVLHRRVPFEPAAPGRARWLRRCYAQTRRDQ
ncbi:TauD/TfdA family dioxygenase [Streptomyces sp. RB6PN25]|uniref:TauD/TfdA family dioxygenase n=1 Tax=Streptomyces humicola TaxID=2953240 RepID=A0ABT1PQW1_9ACTN|nr:TauD/TfdA family dioxygenase [Streptomyces humicola]MCQ4080061.1 TauD/TfdA family dioxygenase [Streptomyces humicola]